MTEPARPYPQARIWTESDLNDVRIRQETADTTWQEDRWLATVAALQADLAGERHSYEVIHGMLDEKSAQVEALQAEVEHQKENAEMYVRSYNRALESVNEIGKKLRVSETENTALRRALDWAMSYACPGAGGCQFSETRAKRFDQMIAFVNSLESSILTRPANPPEADAATQKIEAIDKVIRDGGWEGDMMKAIIAIMRPASPPEEP